MEIDALETHNGHWKKHSWLYSKSQIIVEKMNKFEPDKEEIQKYSEQKLDFENSKFHRPPGQVSALTSD